jgi:uncharacterized protein YbjT (DUF2867 family)
MRVLLTGATGLIGSAILSRLIEDGHTIVAVSRHPARAHVDSPNLLRVALDLTRMPAADWGTHLLGVEAVINCAGVLQDNAYDSTAVHAAGAANLFAACEAANVSKVIHFSAIGVERETPTRFSATKAEGDQALMRRRLDWIILRPSVVLGRPAYGGSALIRGLAALPVLPEGPDQGPLQIVLLDDVVRTVRFFLDERAPVQLAIDVAGPERLSLTAVVQAYRRWLGWKPARIIRAPRWAMSVAYALGDFVGWLGWRSPIRSTAKREIVRGAIGDNSLWRNVTGIEPRSLRAFLMSEPPSVQERWFARLYFLKPMVFPVYAGFWIGTGLIALGPGYDIGVSLMREGGAGALSGPTVIAGGIADIVIGLGIAIRRSAKPALLAAIALSLLYIVTGSLLLPRLWEDPLGPMWKIWPMLVLNFIALAILEER